MGKDEIFDLNLLETIITNPFVSNERVNYFKNMLSKTGKLPVVNVVVMDAKDNGTISILESDTEILIAAYKKGIETISARDRYNNLTEKRKIGELYLSDMNSLVKAGHPTDILSLNDRLEAYMFRTRDKALQRYQEFSLTGK